MLLTYMADCQCFHDLTLPHLTDASHEDRSAVHTEVRVRFTKTRERLPQWRRRGLEGAQELGAPPGAQPCSCITLVEDQRVLLLVMLLA